MSALPVTGVFNDGYIAELMEFWRRDPSSVDESWRQLFRLAESLAGGRPGGAATTSSPDFLRKVAGAASLAEAIRHYGHLAVQLDPLGSKPLGAAELTPEFHDLTESDLAAIPASALGGRTEGSATDVIARLRKHYCSTIGFEIEHLEDEVEREWFRKTIESGELRRSLTPDEKKSVLRRLTEVDGLERFLGRVYLGHKRFSIEGSDVLVPMLDAALERAAEGGSREVDISMAHRGRLNVLAHTLGKPYGWLFEEFEGKPAEEGVSESGDVKYHLGARGKRISGDGHSIDVLLVPNPSHLEFVNPVLEGVARARQRTSGGLDELSVMPVCVHGDAAFIGEGVVAESFNLSRLRGYRTGGTLHIIVNNQVGFTTDPGDARSTYYASDLAKGFDVPVLHVNADDAEACLVAVWMGVAYRERFRKDYVIDVVGYRRHGHNEGDEPAYTQPALYAAIRQHPTARQVWAARLVREGVVTEQDVESLDQQVQQMLERGHEQMKAGESTKEGRAAQGTGGPKGAGAVPPVLQTGTALETLVMLNDRIHQWPADLRVHPRLAKQLQKRKETLQAGGIEWGYAEALAFGALLMEGTSIRLTGQDAERGTFSHRHAVLHDVEDGRTWTPLQHLDGAKGSFEIFNSPLSETAVLGFEYGYSTVAPDALVLWEAQYGDFVNVAQPIIDQFIVSDRAKWGQDSGLVLLLPHGYEGGGPEHSSAKLERFLQLFGENNMVVAYPSTPSQYFHILRRQAARKSRRPLVLMQPKSLLRLAEAASPVAELTSGSFRPVIDDPAASGRREDVRRLVFCTGKIYYDILARSPGAHVAVVRVEELAPWPHEEVARIVDLYPAIEEVVWIQEEPKNMGAWTFVSPRLRASTGNALTIRYVGRPERASPAEGYASSHKREQDRIIAEVLAEMKRGKRDGVGGKRESGKREAGSPTA